jgi:UDP-N-acetylmuramate--alanine ligase
MIKLTEYNKVFFAGIGGIGMSALVRWFSNTGFMVGGYDRTPSDITKALEDDGALITYDDLVETIPPMFTQSAQGVLVIYTPAVPQSSPQLNFFLKNNYTVVKRSVALGMIALQSQAIAVAGTHGKTSVSTMAACIMHQTPMGTNAFLGGISKNFASNCVIKPQSPWMVIEADEYDRSFLTLYPQIALITSMDADHLDIYGNKHELDQAFADFVSQVKCGGKVIIKKGVKLSHEVNKEVKFYTYSLDGSDTDFYAQNIRVEHGEYVFDLINPRGIIKNVILGMPALYNVENAVAASAVAYFAGASDNEISIGLAGYAGVKRRFDIRFKGKHFVFIDDYAHHPEEIKACLRSVRHFYPELAITVVFQPHLYSRTRDFAVEFAESLDMADQVILTDIYPAREEPISGVTSQLIFDYMKLKNKMLVPFDQVVTEATKVKSGVLVTMGAGNIDLLIEPIHEILIADNR